VGAEGKGVAWLLVLLLLVLLLLVLLLGGLFGREGGGCRGEGGGWAAWVPPETSGLNPGRRRPGRRHRDAPPDGHQWVPAPWFPPHTSRGGWGAGCGGSSRAGHQKG
jgi:hypothetical protein